MKSNMVFIRRLSAQFEQKKKDNPRYSLRAFSRDVGITPSELSRLMASKRSMSPQLAYKIGSYLRLPQDELCCLVLSTLAAV